MLIAIEGADGCGKTTLCPILAKKLNATVYSTPPKRYLSSREKVDRDATPEEHYRFYRDGIYDASDEISAILGCGNSVVSDRYWLTTRVYHQAMGMVVPENDFLKVVIPTLWVILSLDHNTQIERMLHRGLSVGDRRMLDKQREIATLFYQGVMDFDLPFLVIDTKRFSPNVCAEIVAEALDF